jgi:hypothetical protein
MSAWQGAPVAAGDRGAEKRSAQKTPMAGAVVQKTAIEDAERIEPVAQRHGDDQIARVPSKLARHTGRGHRWTQARVATLRCR